MIENVKTAIIVILAGVLIWCCKCSKDNPVPEVTGGKNRVDTVIVPRETIITKKETVFKHHYYTKTVVSAPISEPMPIEFTATLDTISDENIDIYIADTIRGTAFMVSRDLKYRQRQKEINHYRADTIFKEKPPSKKRFGVGVFAGAGLGTGGIQPMIGVGITYNIFKF